MANMKTPLIFVVSLATFFIGAVFGVWFNQHRCDDEVRELNATHKLEVAGDAYLNLSDWQHGKTNCVYSYLVFQMECGVVNLTPYIDANPQSEVAMRYHEFLENVVQDQARYGWHSGITNWDSEFDAVLAKTTKKSGH